MGRRRVSALLAVAAALVASLAAPSVAGAAETKVMYRLYNEWTGEHFYTASATERDSLSKVGWDYEGAAWSAPEKSGSPVYRLYNPWVDGGDHHYTTDAHEYAALKEAGWRQEGVGWYSDDARGEALYRLYNPYATTGTHHYTADANERDQLQTLGWDYEGVAWYGIDENASSGDGIYTNVEYQDDVLVIDNYEVTDGGYLVKKSVYDRAVAEWRGRNPSGAKGAGAKSGPTCAAFPANKKNPQGAVGAFEVLDSEYRPDYSDPLLFLKVVQADDPRDVFKKVDLRGTYNDLEMSKPAAASGVKVVSVKDGKLTFKVSKKVGGCSADLEFSVTPVFNFDVDWSLSGFKKCVFEIGLTGTTTLDISAKYSETIPLLKKPIVVNLGNGFSVAFNINLKASADGKVYVKVEQTNTIGAEYKNGKWKDISDNDTDYKKPSFSGTVTAGVQPYGMLQVVTVDLIDLGIDVGAKATGEMEEHKPDASQSSAVTCVDIAAFLYGEINVGTNTKWMKSAGITLPSLVFWDVDSSPVSETLHWENGKKVKKCTFDDGEVTGGAFGDLRVVQVDLGSEHSAAITEDGSLWLWGYNGDFNVGYGDRQENINVPRKLDGLDDVISVALGPFNSAAITDDGSLWTWGSNDSGQVGNGETGYAVDVPTKVMSDVKAAAFGLCHAAAIKKDGSLWTWGLDVDGCLGDDSGVSARYTPKKVLDGVVDMSLGGSTTAAIKTDGSLWMWGDNQYGQFGNGTTEGSATPLKVMDGVSDVATNGESTVILKKDGSVWECGWGLSEAKRHTEPKLVMTGGSSVDVEGNRDIDTNRAAVLKQDGTLWSWGQNEDGRIGDGTKTDRPEPVQIMSGVSSFSLGDSHGAAVKKNGSLWMWGVNYAGELGNGTEVGSLKPIAINDPK